ncbi:hypothetical protein BO94DRAFT_452667, partial [Aspergillus sclerotioniger CBS 115572]
ILHLPAKPLSMIYMALSNIDDALHLARCCTYLNGVFEEQRLEIFRHIIQTADHHTYDPHLSNEIGLHEHFAREMYTTPEIRLDPPRRKALISDYKASRKSSPVLSAEMVWETVVRWQAMRLLFDFYCDESVQGTYGKSAYHWEYDDEAIWDTRNPFPPPSGSMCQRLVSLGDKQRQRVYERFYKALTANWWVAGRRWSAKVDVYESSKQECYVKLADMAEELRHLINPTHRLQEILDMVEIYDFVWSFLARKALQLTSPADWMAAWDSCPIHRVPHRCYHKAHDPWVRYLKHILEYLRPPSIIELVLSAQWAARGDWRVDHEAYLRHLGAMDEPYGV